VPENKKVSGTWWKDLKPLAPVRAFNEYIDNLKVKRKDLFDSQKQVFGLAFFNRKVKVNSDLVHWGFLQSDILFRAFWIILGNCSANDFAALEEDRIVEDRYYLFYIFFNYYCSSSNSSKCMSRMDPSQLDVGKTSVVYTELLSGSLFQTAEQKETAFFKGLTFIAATVFFYIVFYYLLFYFVLG